MKMEENMFNIFDRESYIIPDYKENKDSFFYQNFRFTDEDSSSNALIEDDSTSYSTEQIFLQNIKTLFFQNDIDQLEIIFKDKFNDFYCKKLYFFFSKLKLYKLLSRGNLIEAFNFYHKSFLPLLKKNKHHQWKKIDKNYQNIFTRKTNFPYLGNDYLTQLFPYFEKKVKKLLQEFNSSSNTNFIKDSLFHSKDKFEEILFENFNSPHSNQLKEQNLINYEEPDDIFLNGASSNNNQHNFSDYNCCDIITNLNYNCNNNTTNNFRNNSNKVNICYNNSPYSSPMASSFNTSKDNILDEINFNLNHNNPNFNSNFNSNFNNNFNHNNLQLHLDDFNLENGYYNHNDDNAHNNNENINIINSSNFVTSTSPESTPHSFHLFNVEKPKNKKRSGSEHSSSMCSTSSDSNKSGQHQKLFEVISQNNKENDNLESNKNKQKRPKQKSPENYLHKILPMLANFKPSYTKRENIDKKTIRKFRHYLLSEKKTGKIKIETEKDSNFWILFLNGELFPPINYNNPISKEVTTFRSFNASYLIWLFSKSKVNEYFEQFIQAQGKDFIESLIKSYKITSEEDKEQLFSYVTNLPKIFEMNLITETNYQKLVTSKKPNNKKSNGEGRMEEKRTIETELGENWKEEFSLFATEE